MNERNNEVFRRYRKYKTHYFTKEEVDCLIDGETYLNRKTAFQIAYDAGARAGEIIKVSAEHLEFGKGQMIMWDSKKKSWKITPLSDETINLVNMYLRASKIKTRLFSVTTVTLNNWLSDACIRCEVESDPGLSIRWHSWRGTFIRHNSDKGYKWLMQVTGDSLQTILSYYSELTDEDLRKIKVGDMGGL